MPRRSKVSLLDTNVILRDLLGDDSAQTPRARAQLARLERGAERAELREAVLAEAVWVLERHYGVPRPEIARSLSAIVGLRGLRFQGKPAALAALGLFAASRADIVDCLLAARASRRGADVVSFDRDFRSLRCGWRMPE